MTYKRGKNWNVKSDSFVNGRGQRIYKPHAYFRAVAKNRYGYNGSFENGYGEKIEKPRSYYKAVAEDRYGYNFGSKKKRRW
ncbi:MAG: hypothetical protein Kow0037_30830 [Calditrichia bacterium]